MFVWRARNAHLVQLGSLKLMNSHNEVDISYILDMPQ